MGECVCSGEEGNCFLSRKEGEDKKDAHDSNVAPRLQPFVNMAYLVSMPSPHSPAQACYFSALPSLPQLTWI